MRTRVDARLQAEAVRFRLCYTCEACAHFDRETLACSAGFPTEQHFDVDLERAREVVFCKQFELG